MRSKSQTIQNARTRYSILTYNCTVDSSFSFFRFSCFSVGSSHRVIFQERRVGQAAGGRLLVYFKIMDFWCIAVPCRGCRVAAGAEDQGGGAGHVLFVNLTDSTILQYRERFIKTREGFLIKGRKTPRACDGILLHRRGVIFAIPLGFGQVAHIAFRVKISQRRVF